MVVAHLRDNTYFIWSVDKTWGEKNRSTRAQRVETNTLHGCLCIEGIRFILLGCYTRRCGEEKKHLR
jgi:hypothetical protein